MKINIKYLLLFSLQTIIGKKNIPKHLTNNDTRQVLFVIQQTFGVKTIMSLFNNSPIINQQNQFGHTLANGQFIRPSSMTLNKKYKKFHFFKFSKTYNDNKETINVYGDPKSNELLVEGIYNKNNEKKQETYGTNNIYYLLKKILELDITLGTNPDYLQKENQITLKHGENVAQVYRLYYASMGQYRVYNSLTYLNEQVNLRMGAILNTLDIPMLVLHSGDGKEIFIYLGVHFCPKDKRTYYGILLLSFDVLSVCRDLFYYIEKCPHCHSHIPGNINNGQAIFKIQKNYGLQKN